MTRWLVTGADGMLGRDLATLIDGSGEDCVALGRTSLDLMP